MAGTILIRGGRVYDHEGDTDRPPAADILIEDDRIAGIAPEIPAERAGRVIDAADKLVLPGFVNAHYHSHDTMLKGMLHPVPWRCLGGTRGGAAAIGNSPAPQPAGLHR